MHELQFDIQSYWRAGTGRGGGALLDEHSLRDTHGLPCLPGRSVKGLLRDAVWRLEQWQHIEPGVTDDLFGIRPDIGEPATAPSAKDPMGRLRVSSARLAEDVREYLVGLKQHQPEQFADLVSGFFHEIHATAMEDGVAKDTSLRVMEVVIPLPLRAELCIRGATDRDWALIIKSLPLIRAVGSSRQRGLGRVAVTLRSGKRSSNGGEGGHGA